MRYDILYSLCCISYYCIALVFATLAVGVGAFLVNNFVRVNKSVSRIINAGILAYRKIAEKTPSETAGTNRTATEEQGEGGNIFYRTLKLISASVEELEKMTNQTKTFLNMSSVKT